MRRGVCRTRVPVDARAKVRGVGLCVAKAGLLPVARAVV